MKTPFVQYIVLLAFAMIAISSCQEKKPHFTIEGKVTGADSTTLYLEKQELGNIAIIDSVRLNADGEFQLTGDAPQYSEFYALKLDNQVINIAIDSIETITLNADKATFATQYTIDGSADSEQMKEIILEQYKLTNTVRSMTLNLQKDEISQDYYMAEMGRAISTYKTYAEKIIRADYTGLASYFALFQKVGDLLIFDPYDKSDRSLYQAVATVWLQKSPESPRSKQLEKFVLGVLSEIRTERDREKQLEELTNSSRTINSQEFFTISLPDASNKTIDLTSLKGKVVLLDFTAYQTDYSPSHNILLNKVYEKYAGKLVIYQVSFDDDNHFWKNTVVNLPWICVRDSKSLNSELIQKFNIQNLPTTYLLDKQGNIIKRFFASDDIEAEVKKVL